MQEEEIQVNSVSEFIEKIVQLDKEEGTETFYRGHANRDWEFERFCNNHDCVYGT